MVAEEIDERRKPRRKALETQEPIRLQVSELLQGSRVVILEHEGQDYRLRVTVNGKLILTK